MTSPALQRREIHYSGNVQGVGFRYTTRSIARGYAVTGFVKNLRDGRVQVVVEGAPDEVQAFLDHIRAEMGYHISRADEQPGPATGEFSGFEVRF